MNGKDLNWGGVNGNKRELTIGKNFLEKSLVYDNKLDGCVDKEGY